MTSSSARKVWPRWYRLGVKSGPANTLVCLDGRVFEVRRRGGGWEIGLTWDDGRPELTWGVWPLTYQTMKAARSVAEQLAQVRPGR